MDTHTRTHTPSMWVLMPHARRVLARARARGGEREGCIPSSLITRNHRTHGKRERERERTREKERGREGKRHTRTQSQTPRAGLTWPRARLSSFAHGSSWATRRASIFRCVSVCIMRIHAQCTQIHTLTHVFLKCECMYKKDV